MNTAWFGVGVASAGDLNGDSYPDFYCGPAAPTDRASGYYRDDVRRLSCASLVVHDSAGRVVHRIADALFVPGRHVLVWDRRNDDGRVVPSGIYFVRLQVPGVLLTRKTILIQ